MNNETSVSKQPNEALTQFLFQKWTSESDKNKHERFWADALYMLVFMVDLKK
jgi:hypothetical protein